MRTPCPLLQPRPRLSLKDRQWMALGHTDDGIVQARLEGPGPGARTSLAAPDHALREEAGADPGALVAARALPR